MKEYGKKYRTEHKNQIRERMKEWYNKNKEYRLQYFHNYRIRLRYLVLTHYGGNPPKCNCCGENNIEFLSIDHINKDGATQRRKNNLHSGGHNFYRWIIKQGFPKGYRVLCMNCNTSFGFFGYCPHHSQRFINNLNTFNIRRHKWRLIKEN